MTTIIHTVHVLYVSCMYDCTIHTHTHTHTLMNGGHHSSANRAPDFMVPPRASPQFSTYTDDAPSSITRFTESSFVDFPSGTMSRRSLSVDMPTRMSPQLASESPWLYSGRERLRPEYERRTGVLPHGLNHGEHSNWNSSHYPYSHANVSRRSYSNHPHMHHYYRGHHRSMSNPLAKVSQ